MTFQFDTSGAVMLAPGCIWTDLSPFVQGYVEAMLRAASAAVHAERDAQGRERSRFDRDLGFSDLAPETLARIMEDCERCQKMFGKASMGAKRYGASFWERRQRGDNRTIFGPMFPPLTPYLGDDGKVYLREAD